MAGRRALVVGFGTGSLAVGFAVTANLPNYEIKRRRGEWESTFVGPAGHLQYVIPVSDRGHGEALRDELNNAQANIASARASALTIGRHEIEILNKLLEVAVTHDALDANVAFNDAVWSLVDGSLDETARILQDLEARFGDASDIRQDSDAMADFSTFAFSGVVFDLDQTLVDSSALGTPDQKRWWARSPDRDTTAVKRFPTNSGVAPDDIPRHLREQGIPVGLITRSPVGYCNAVLDQHQIEVDAVIPACGDKRAALRRCADGLGVRADEIVLVGDDASDFSAARAVGAWSVGALWQGEPWHPRHQPDIAVEDPSLLLATADWPALRYIGETNGKEIELHAGSLLAFGDNFALGRYFSSRDSRHGDPLSAAIIAGKNKTGPEPQIAAALQQLPNLHHFTRAHVVASMPPRLGQRDRFREYRKLLADSLGAVPLELLSEVKKVTGYKWMSPSQKLQENAGRFECIAELSGASVLILDDVITTGSVMLACKEALQSAGAGEVVCLAFGATQAAA